MYRYTAKYITLMQDLPFARYETEQDKQDQYHHFPLLSSMLYLLLLCLTIEEPEKQKLQ